MSTPEVSATEPDWSRERPRRFFDPSRCLLKALRDYEALGTRRAPLRRRVIRLRHRIWSLFSQAEISLGTRIGGGLLMPHPNGIVVHPQTVMGPNCLLMQQVTIGIGRPGSKPAVIGGHVDISAGAKVIGPITIGDHAVIGANAVVTRDVPPYAIVVGIPARQIGTTKPE